MTKPPPLPALQAAPPLLPKKVYTREFKRETLRLLQSSGQPKADLARDLGLYPGQIRMWRRAMGRNEVHLEPAFPGAGHQSDRDAQLCQLRRENEILRQERDILKKAVTIEKMATTRGGGCLCPHLSRGVRGRYCAPKAGHGNQVWELVSPSSACCLSHCCSNSAGVKYPNDA